MGRFCRSILQAEPRRAEALRTGGWRTLRPETGSTSLHLLRGRHCCRAPRACTGGCWWSLPAPLSCVLLPSRRPKDFPGAQLPVAVGPGRHFGSVSLGHLGATMGSPARPAGRGRRPPRGGEGGGESAIPPPPRPRPAMPAFRTFHGDLSTGHRRGCSQFVNITPLNYLT